MLGDRLGDEAAVHVGVAARLVDEERAHVVEVLLRVAALGEDRVARDRVDPARDDAERLARGVVVDGLDPALRVTASDSRSGRRNGRPGAGC